MTVVRNDDDPHQNISCPATFCNFIQSYNIWNNIYTDKNVTSTVEVFFFYSLGFWHRRRVPNKPGTTNNRRHDPRRLYPITNDLQPIRRTIYTAHDKRLCVETHACYFAFKVFHGDLLFAKLKSHHVLSANRVGPSTVGMMFTRRYYTQVTLSHQTVNSQRFFGIAAINHNI